MIWVVKRMGYCMCSFYHMISNTHVRIRHGARVHYSTKFEGYNIIGENSYFRGNIGFCSYIGSNSIVMGKIGRFCSIARDVRFLSATHPTKNFISTSPAFYSIGLQSGIAFVNRQKFDEIPTLQGSDYSFEVGNDVYIGAGVTLIGPIRIGDGAIIAANSTVIHDVEPYSIVGGTPAKLIKKRFTEQEIEFLLHSKWWDNDIGWFKKNGDAFESIDAFKKIIGEIHE